jgi:hypothetical protein
MCGVYRPRLRGKPLARLGGANISMIADSDASTWRAC